MEKGRKRRLILLGGLLLALGTFFFRPSLLFQIKNCKTETVLYTRSVREGFEFATAITHSVQKTPVYEYFRVEKDGTILVTKTILQDLGWGMPSNLDSPVIFTEDSMIMDQINRPLPRLYFRINYIAQPHLVLMGSVIDPSFWAQDGDLFEIKAARLPWIVSRLRSGVNAFGEKDQDGRFRGN